MMTAQLILLAALVDVAGIGFGGAFSFARTIQTEFLLPVTTSARVVQQALWELCMGNITAGEAVEDAARAIAQVGRLGIVDTPLLPISSRAGACIIAMRS